MPNTGNFNTFKTITKNVTLPAGQQVIRVAFDALPTGGDAVAGLNWLRLTPVAAVKSLIVANNFLLDEVERFKTMVSTGYSRGALQTRHLP